MASGFGHIQERKIFQWALAYAGAAWFLLQLLDAVESPLGLAPSTFLFAGVIVAAGFPIALVLAWYHGEKGRQRVTGPELVMIATLLAIAAVALGAASGRYNPGGPSTVSEPDAEGLDPLSVAVLPFANLSPNPEDAYFTDGMHEEIISRLSRVSALRVISRTSVMPYRSADRNLRLIAADLGAGSILEGSVRRAGSRIRLTAQLIDANTDTHLWSDSFEAELTAESLFSLQIRIATSVAEALSARLSTDEAARVQARPTQNLKAYEFFLLGNAAMARGYAERDLRHAIAMFEQAVELDPTFSHAYAQLSRVHGEMIWFAYDRSESRLTASRVALEKARSLDQNAAAVMVATGVFHYQMASYDSALHWLDQARSLQPKNADITERIAFVLRRQGRMEDAARLMEEALVSNPISSRALFNLGETYLLLHRCGDALPTLRRSAAAMPSWPRPPAYEAWGVVACGGDLNRARHILREAAPLLVNPADDGFFHLNGFYIELFAQRFDSAVAWLSGQEEVSLQFLYRPATLLRAEAHWLAGDTQRALASVDSARNTLEAKLRAWPDDERYHGALALVNAYLGRRAEAIRSARRAIDLVGDRDAYRLIFHEEELALVHVILGEHSEASAVYARLLDKPGVVTSQLLSLDPRLQAFRTSGVAGAVLNR